MDEIINYVMNTPGNTNPNVLRGMLENNSGGGDYKFVEVARQEEFEWESGKEGVNWGTTNNSFDMSILEENIYAIKMLPYINDFTSVNFYGDKTYIFAETGIFSDYAVSIGDNINIGPFESTPEVESIILYKLVPVNYQENEEVEPSSMEEA